MLSFLLLEVINEYQQGPIMSVNSLSVKEKIRKVKTRTYLEI